MAEEGFKRQLAAIITTTAKRCSRLMHDPEEPLPHKLTPYSTSMTGLVQQYWLTEFYWATGCDERKYLINVILKSITIKEKSHGKTNYQL